MLDELLSLFDVDLYKWALGSLAVPFKRKIISYGVDVVDRLVPSSLHLGVSNNCSPANSKPAEFFEMVEGVSPGPRLEMFARAPREGWSVWGNEVKSDVRI